MGVVGLDGPAPRALYPPLMFSAKRAAHLFSSARRARWLAPPIRTALALVLIGLAASAMVYLLPSGEPVSGDTPAAASSAVPSPGVVRTAVFIPPAAATIAQTDDRGPAPAALTAQTAEGGGSVGRRASKSRASHKWRLVRRVHTTFFHVPTAILPEPCRYSCDDWAEPVTWHGGGY